jgi:UDP-N-acetylmuramate--alanine ligase
MDLNDIKAVYFVGIGGIGMSAIARYFLSRQTPVGGYDRTPSHLTERLQAEGAKIIYTDEPNDISPEFKNPRNTLVVYTPAIPAENKVLSYYKNMDFDVEKRAQVLGALTRAYRGLCVAGTHGKTTTSTMAAHILHQSSVGCNAFLGGISKNYGTNYLLSSSSPYVVIEADEYDRSFHQLTPYASVITAVDADHLDIYGTHEAYLESFEKYTSLIRKGGALVIHEGLALKPALHDGVRQYTYGLDKGDFHAENIRTGNGRILFDLVSPFGNISNIELGVPVYVNIENGVAAIALAQIAGVSAEDIREGMRTFSGVERRFDIRIKSDKIVLISDYAHHPKEIEACINSVRKVFAGRKISAIFQPHLYSRTRDFYKEFAAALSLLDQVVLTEIYPARERLIPGVTSRLIYDNLRPDMDKFLIRKSEVLSWIKDNDVDVLLILGAGDLNELLPEISKILLPRS